MTRSSLSRLLYRRVLLLLALTGLALGAILYNFAQREIGIATDAQLVNAAHLLERMMQDELTSGVLVQQDQVIAANGDPLISPEDAQAFQASYDSCMFIVFWKGRVVTQSGVGGPLRNVPRETGLHSFTALGGKWRSFGLEGTTPGLLIVVAQRGDMREFSIPRMLGELAIPLVGLMLASTMVLWWTLHKGFAKVESLASTLNARSLSDLAPLIPGEWPSDFGPIITSLNRLFDRLGGAYELEQTFTDDVAHELRTPLAAIRAQAQMVHKLGSAVTHQDLDRLVAMVDRAHKLIEGMLVLARLNATALALRSIDVHALVADVVADALMALPADAMECSVTPEHVVRWTCDAALLQIALAAVIGNATRHARDGGRLDIALMRGEDRLVVTVADRGPGIPRAERERMTRRFEHGSLATSGSGLGLSIASKALGLLGGALWLKDRPDGTGLLVVMSIGMAPAPR